MESIKKASKLASDIGLESQTSDLLRKKEQNQSNVTLDPKDTKTGSPSQDNGECVPILQWPYVSPHAGEQSSITQPTLPFWVPHRPDHQFGDSIQPFTLGPNDTGCHASGVVGAASRNQTHIPNLCSHVGYQYPGCPGPWYPSSWGGQPQQSQLPITYPFSGACGYFSSPPLPMSVAKGSIGQLSQRGNIHTPADLSKQRQQLWEAQSAANIQLWAVIGQLQSELADYKNRLMKLEADVSSSKPAVEDPNGHPDQSQPCSQGQLQLELADYKSRLMKLEAEVSSLKPAVEDHNCQVSGTTIPGQASKKARLMGEISSMETLASPDQSQLRARGQLQSELADHKNRLIKLEVDVSSLKSAMEDLNNQVIGTAKVGPASKRGRPRRAVSSINTLPSPHQSQSCAQGQLQSELADYKSSLTKLKKDILTMKPAMEKSNCQVTGTAKAGQASKKGRSKRPIASIDALPSPDQSQPCDQHGKLAASKFHSLAKLLNFEKVILKKVENRENLMMPGFHTVHQEHPRGQRSRVGHSPSLQTKNNDDKAEDKEMNSKSASTEGHLGWPSSIQLEDGELSEFLP